MAAITASARGGAAATATLRKGSAVQGRGAAWAGAPQSALATTTQKVAS